MSYRTHTILILGAVVLGIICFPTMFFWMAWIAEGASAWNDEWARFYLSSGSALGFLACAAAVSYALDGRRNH